MKRVYLDHTATTPLDERVLEAMRPYFAGTFGNASSVHWYGQQAKAALETARATIARCIGAEPGELFFTSGGTESDNLAIRGAAEAGKRRGRNRLATTKAEHHAVLDTCEALSELGFEVTFLDVDSDGAVDPGAAARCLTENTSIISVMHANNEVGTISPVSEISRAAHERGVLVHCDAVQTLGKLPVDVKSLDVDLLSTTAHKLYGPKGIGALYVRRGTPVDPMLSGGGQERGMRPGTENVPLAVGFARAVELAVAEMEKEADRLRALRDALEISLTSRIPGIIVNGNPRHRLPHILNISFDSRRMPLEGEMLIMNMDLQGIAVTSGSACSSGSMQPSHVLLAMGRDGATARATIRFSFGKGNVQEDIDYVTKCLADIIDRMKAK